jgi:hypothetical protein
MTAAEISSRMMFSTTVSLAFQPGTRLDVGVPGSKQNESDCEVEEVHVFHFSWS